MANYSPEAMGGNTSFSVLFNYTGTEVTDRNPEVVDEDRVYQLEQSLPNMRAALSGVHPFGKVRSLLRATYYDDWYDVGDEHDYPGRFIVDAELALDLSNNASVTIGAQKPAQHLPGCESERAERWGAVPREHAVRLQRRLLLRADELQLVVGDAVASGHEQTGKMSHPGGLAGCPPGCHLLKRCSGC